MDEPLTREEIIELRAFLDRCIYSPPTCVNATLLYRWYLALGRMLDDSRLPLVPERGSGYQSQERT